MLVFLSGRDKQTTDIQDIEDANAQAKLASLGLKQKSSQIFSRC